LNRINALFDVWIDVQRRWVYLDGIFGSSVDIKHLLPVETSRFQSVSTEFLSLMKRVGKSPLVMDVLNIQGVQKTLERLAELLAKIQKALGEYLERERASFPRFYFVGDEDLLEIIGNSKNIGRLQKHFKKMFAGVHTLLMNEDNTIVHGVISKEGEQVHFYTPISIMDSSINEWLTRVEKEISLTLAKLLSRAIPELIKIQGNLADDSAFVQWLDQYQVDRFELVNVLATILFSVRLNWLCWHFKCLGRRISNEYSSRSPKPTTTTCCRMLFNRSTRHLAFWPIWFLQINRLSADANSNIWFVDPSIHFLNVALLLLVVDHRTRS
jgi:dynein heavy chain 1, cytosolic